MRFLLAGAGGVTLSGNDTVGASSLGYNVSLACAILS